MELPTGIYYHTGNHKYYVSVRIQGRRKHVGAYRSAAEAIIAQHDYMTRFDAGEVDYNDLARDPEAWKKEAESVIKKLSKEYGGKR